MPLNGPAPKDGWVSPSTLTELKNICKDEYHNIPKSTKLVASPPRRLEAALAVFLYWIWKAILKVPVIFPLSFKGTCCESVTKDLKLKSERVRTLSGKIHFSKMFKEYQLIKKHPWAILSLTGSVVGQLQLHITLFNTSSKHAAPGADNRPMNASIWAKPLLMCWPERCADRSPSWSGSSSERSRRDESPSPLFPLCCLRQPDDYCRIRSLDGYTPVRREQMNPSVVPTWTWEPFRQGRI